MTIRLLLRHAPLHISAIGLLVAAALFAVALGAPAWVTYVTSALAGALIGPTYAHAAGHGGGARDHSRARDPLR